MTMLKVRNRLKNIERSRNSEKDRHKLLRLDMNEYIGEFPSGVIEKLLHGIDEDFLSSYPEYHAIYSKLANRWSVPDNFLLLTNGSDSASKLLFDTCIEENDKVILTDPTFAMHEVYAKTAGAEIIKVPYGSDYSFPFEQLIKRVDSNIKLLVIVSPVNPYGTVITETHTRLLLETCKAHDVMCYIDEAYGEFASFSAIGFVKTYKNLMVTRTFSKAYGLAGLRLGYIVAQSDFIKALGTVQPTYDVNKIAVKFGEYFLDHPEILQFFIEKIREGRDFLVEALSELGVSFHIGVGNFALIDLGLKKDSVIEYLKENKVLVATKFSQPHLATFIRISIGSKLKMSAFIECLRLALVQ